LKTPPPFGFTLVEVLVALGLFAFAVIGLLGGIGAMAEMADEARISAIVRQQLESRVAFLEVRRPEEFQDTIKTDFPRMTILEGMKREQVQRTNGKPPLEGIWRVEIRAQWQTSGRRGEEKVSFLRYEPQ